MSKSFDRVSHLYDETRGYPPGVAEAIQQWLEQNLGLTSERSRLLELGVGSGRIAVPFILAGYDYTGVDISKKMLDRLRAKLGGDLRRATLLLADLHSLPLPDHSVDAVLAVHILHLVETERALAETLRVLKPGGALVWAWDHSDPRSERAAIRRRYREFVSAHVAPDNSWAKNDVGRAWLAARGLPEPPLGTAVQWSVTYTARQVIANLAERAWSSTWDTPADVHAAAVNDVQGWAPAALGDLDAPRTVTSEFQLHVYRMP